MVRTEISLFLQNVPGELGKLSYLLANAGINIDALTIQVLAAVRKCTKFGGLKMRDRNGIKSSHCKAVISSPVAALSSQLQLSIISFMR